jgi:hypothetical protein
MRTAKDPCRLCEENEATQKNSHLIPKYFGKGLFDNTNPRHSISIEKSGKRQKVQDIIKEDFLLCPRCEKGLSIFETYCIIRLDRFNDLRHFSKFEKFKKGDFEYFESKELDIKVFNLFIYSIVWRISVSESYAFGGFKLPIAEEEKLKSLLRNFIESRQEKLLARLDELQVVPNHGHAIIRPKKKLRPPNAMLSAASMDGWLHEVHLVDYILFYSTDKEKFINSLKELDNNNLKNRVKVGLSSPESWKTYSIKMIKDALKRNK